MKRILIVDDQIEIVELVDVIIRKKDYLIFRSDCGEEAIEIAKAEKPELIIMDVKMPGKVDGLEATRIIKNDPELKKCSIILMSGKDNKIDIKKGSDAGADDYIIKPFDPNEFYNKVKEILE